MKKVEYYKLNYAGVELYQAWEREYYHELDRLRKELNNPEYEEGWSIIDDCDYVKTVSDEVGLLVFGYDDNLMWFLNEWKEVWNESEKGIFFTDAYGIDYTVGEIEYLAKKYYVKKVTWK